MTREEIEQINEIEPYSFETSGEEQWYRIGLLEGLETADANPKSPWVSVNDDLPCETVVVVSGTARGVDRLGEQYTRERGYPIERYPADWDRYGKSVGFHRNEQMVAVADGAVMFWNVESHGTRHDIELSRKKGIPHVIKMYKINKSE